MTYDIEVQPQEGTKEQAGGIPETVRVYTMDALDTTIVTTLTRWDDDPFTIEKRVASRPRSSAQDTPEHLDKLVTSVVARALEERGCEWEAVQ